MEIGLCIVSMCYKPSKHTAHTWYAIGTSDILQWTCHDRIHHVSPGAFCIIVPLLRAHIASKQDSKFPHRTHRTAHQYLLCTLLASIHEPHNKRSHRQNNVPKLPSSATKISCFANDMGSNRAGRSATTGPYINSSKGKVQTCWLSLDQNCHNTSSRSSSTALCTGVTYCFLQQQYQQHSFFRLPPKLPSKGILRGLSYRLWSQSPRHWGAAVAGAAAAPASARALEREKGA